jgi:hypothetical protein
MLIVQVYKTCDDGLCGGAAKPTPDDISVDIHAYCPVNQKTFRLQVEGQQLLRILERRARGRPAWENRVTLSQVLGNGNGGVEKGEDDIDCPRPHDEENLEILLDHVRYKRAAGQDVGRRRTEEAALSLSLRPNPRRGKHLRTRVFCQDVVVSNVTARRPLYLPEEVGCFYTPRYGRHGWHLRLKADQTSVSFGGAFVATTTTRVRGGGGGGGGGGRSETFNGYFATKEEALLHRGWFLELLNQRLLRPVIRKERRVMSVHRWYDWFDVCIYDPVTSSSRRHSVSVDMLCTWICEEEARTMAAAAMTTTRRRTKGTAVRVQQDQQDLFSEEIVHNRHDFSEATVRKESPDGGGARGPAITTTASTEDRHLRIRTITLEVAQAVRAMPVRAQLLVNPQLETQLVSWLMEVLHADPEASLRGAQNRHALRLETAAISIQGMWRKKASRHYLVDLAKRVFRRAFDASAKQYYYTNTVNGRAQWDCPSLLAKEEHVFEDEEDAWIVREEEGTGRTYYYNPAWDRYSWISEHEAATRVQRAIRKHQLEEAIGSSCVSLSRVERMQKAAKAVQFQANAVQKYQDHPQKLCNLVNYALLLHSQLSVVSSETALSFQQEVHDVKGLYALAYHERGGRKDALVLISYALVLTMDPLFDDSLQPVPPAAEDMVVEALRLDPDLTYWRNAEESFFKWAVMTSPGSPCALFSMALICQLVYSELDRAELFYRRALRHLAAAEAQQRENERSRKTVQVEETVASRYFALKRERGRDGKYGAHGPDVETRQGSSVVCQVGEWQQMEARPEEEDPEGAAWSLPNPQSREAGHHQHGGGLSSRTWWRNCLNGDARWGEPGVVSVVPCSRLPIPLPSHDDRA